MLASLLPKIIVPVVIACVFVLFRRMAPPRSRVTEHRYDETQGLEPLATGVVGSAMWGLGIGIALLFFVLRGANHWWASLDGPSTLTQYAPPVIWTFFPAFAALVIPWPLTIWYLRKVGRWEEADSIEDASDQKGGLNSFRIMKWLSIAVVAPIAVLTLLAIPIHLSISNSEVRLGHYASLHSEQFSLRDAKRLIVVGGNPMRDGSFRGAKDVIIDFSDGRRLSGNQVGDGGTNIRADVMQALISMTGLQPQHVSSLSEVPSTQ